MKEFSVLKFIHLFVRKVVQYILLSLFIWQIVGFVAYFEFSHIKLKKEIKLLLKQGVPDNELVSFKFSNTELEQLIWLKKNEFNLNGNLFDVVERYKSSDGTTHMRCISDKKETILFARLEQTISQNLGDEQSQTPISNWMKLLKIPTCFSQNSFLIKLLDFQQKEFSSIPCRNNYSLVSTKILSPPPQIS